MSNFVYMNLESFICVSIAALVFTLAAARIAAGEECSSFYTDIEIKSTSVL